MTQTPADWYPDPLGRFQFRYWDGAGWSQHVSTDGRAQADPLPGTFGAYASGPADRTVYCDVQVRLGSTQTRLFVDEHAVWHGEQAYRFAGLTALTCWATRVSGVGAGRVVYEARLWRGDESQRIRFQGLAEQAPADEARVAYDGLGRALYERAGTRILADVVTSLDAGHEVTIAGWTLSRAGVRQGKKAFEWGSTLRCHPDGSGRFRVLAAAPGGREKRVGLTRPEAPNASLLPTLFDIGNRRYAGSVAAAGTNAQPPV
jgi:hypothetical protein